MRPPSLTSLVLVAASLLVGSGVFLFVDHGAGVVVLGLSRAVIAVEDRRRGL